MVSGDACKQADEQEMTDCLRPLINTWQAIQRKSPETTEIMFGLFLFKRSDLDQLCVDYRWLKDTCFSKRMENCKENPYMTFFESMFSFACGPNSKAFFDRLDCIKAATAGSNQCANWIRGAYLPGKEEQKCANMQPYFSCMINNIKESCSAIGAEVFKGAIESFGCPLQLPVVPGAERFDVPRSNVNGGFPRAASQGNLGVLGKTFKNFIDSAGDSDVFAFQPPLSRFSRR